VELHSYDPALIGFGIALVVASAIVLCLGPYRYPAEPRRSKADLHQPAQTQAQTA